MLGAVLTLMLTPFMSTADIPSSCSFAAAVENDSSYSITLYPVARFSKTSSVVIGLEGVHLTAQVKTNWKTPSRDVLIVSRDREGRRLVVALQDTGTALLLRELIDGPVERLTGHCSPGGQSVRRWFAG